MRHSFSAVRNPIQYNERGELFLSKDSIRSFIPVNTYDTPLIIVHLGIIREKLRRFRQALPNIHPYFSLNASTDNNTLSTLATGGTHFVIHSSLDIDLLLSLHIPAEHMLYANKVHTPQDIEHAARHGLRRFTVDCAEEMCKIIKVLPHAELYLHIDMSTVRGSNQHWPLVGHPGAWPSDVSLLIEEAKQRSAQLCGISFHVGSQCFNPQCWMEGIRRAHATAQIMQHAGLPLRLLNIGGGFPIELNKSIPAIEDTARMIQQALKVFSKQVTVIAEPSRFLIGDSGYLISRILQKTQRAHKNWLHIDAGSLDALLESQYGIQYPILTDLSGQNCRWQIAGAGLHAADLCFKDYVLPNKLEENHFLYIKNAVAYQNTYTGKGRLTALPYTITIDSPQQEEGTTLLPSH